MPRKHPFVVPGGRFQETYYWDSYWIVLGLMTSGLFVTARRMVENLLEDVLEYGFCPQRKPAVLPESFAAAAPLGYGDGVVLPWGG